LTAYLYHYEKISSFYSFLFFSILLLSTVICSAILEQKKWVIYAEYTRLILALMTLNSMYYFKYNTWFLLVLIVSLSVTIYFLTWFTLNINNKYLVKFNSRN
ncbi:MAG TPA: hypothetical protein PKZ14_07745, partial [Chitinophagales bacterium]|nr:hypothetical protein [Chitinophagales bacterium]